MQLRFCDASLDAGLADVETLIGRYAKDDDVRVGVAPHSVRAIPPTWLDDIARFAFGRAVPVHMHVAEQTAEVVACVAETKCRPVELLAEHGLLCEQFVAVHATHITPSEAALLGRAGAFVCLCPTTERDLGDGLPDLATLGDQKVRLCLGVDGYVVSDPFEEMRAAIGGERLRTGRRFEPWVSPAETMWKAASHDGAVALGFDDAGGTIDIQRDAPGLELVSDNGLLDALVFSGSRALVQRVVRTP